MRALAEFIMRGRMQATLVVAGSAAVPFLFWLSAAAGSLVLLRRGLSDALGVLGWAALPALAWWFLGDPRVALTVGGSVVLALILRERTAWQWVMLASVAIGLLFAWVLGQTFGDRIGALAGELQQALPQVLSGAYQELSEDERARLEGLLAPVLTGLLAALLQIVTLLCLMLGRFWQAQLYNPGGFGREFRALRFRPAVAGVLLLGLLLGPNVAPDFAVLTPLCSVPLVFAGLALMHGLVAQGRMARFWLVGLYVGLLLTQLIYPLLAILAVIDSVFDFRGRKARSDGQGPADREG